MPNYYEVLGVPRGATEDEVRRAYRAIARESHPDRAGDDQEARVRFEQATAAYEVLTDPERRRKYDRRFAPIESVHDIFRSPAGKRFMERMLPRPPAAPHPGMDMGMIVHVPPSIMETGGIVHITTAHHGVVPLEVRPPTTRQWGVLAHLGEPGTPGKISQFVGTAYGNVNGDLYIKLPTTRR